MKKPLRFQSHVVALAKPFILGAVLASSQVAFAATDNNQSAANTTITLPQWRASQAYKGGEIVTLNGRKYQAKWWTLGENPLQSGRWGVWLDVGQDSDSLTQDFSGTVPISTPAPVIQESTSSAEVITPALTETDKSVKPKHRVAKRATEVTCDNATIADWQSGTIYLQGHQAVFAGDIYQARWWIQFSEPDSSDAWFNTGTTLAQLCADKQPKTASLVATPAPGYDHIMYHEELEATKRKQLQSGAFNRLRQDLVTLDNAEVERVMPGQASNPDNVKRVEAIFSLHDWQDTFPLAHGHYSYRGLLQAVAKFPRFCGEYASGIDAQEICSKSLAVMFAHIVQDTGDHQTGGNIESWRRGLQLVREPGCQEQGPSCDVQYNQACENGSWQADNWPCAANVESTSGFEKYFGRGAKPLRFHHQYGQFSEVIFADKQVLLKQPERVAHGWLNLATAVYSLVKPQGNKPSLLHVIDGTWQPNDGEQSNALEPGFGLTTFILTNGLECGEDKHFQDDERIGYYQRHAANLSVPVYATEQLSCLAMKEFPDDLNGHGAVYWDQDWEFHPQNPDGKSYQCKRVNYQTPFSALIESDYQRCVEHFFNVQVISQSH
ncbi:glycoside hydrolase family 19 protein [Motilimonas pumila]|uniref:Chitin-binding protein n=1 Tax=Motilimonas pumila TaxID=2303987 RepID=A0A418YFP5_9GAMM|nr:glycoside hydrolase family 19 protein [Motilimonas pumila]RJG47959.1 chitin-binding protein [Motilimonas pumila]